MSYHNTQEGDKMKATTYTGKIINRATGKTISTHTVIALTADQAVEALIRNHNVNLIKKHITVEPKYTKSPAPVDVEGERLAAFAKLVKPVPAQFVDTRQAMADAINSQTPKADPATAARYSLVLLDALEALLSECADYVRADGGDESEAMQQARAAIQLAKGV
jgi:methylglyoxal synthase